MQKRAVGNESGSVLQTAITQGPLAAATSAAQAVAAAVSNNGRQPAQRRRSTTFRTASDSMDSIDSMDSSASSEEDAAIAAAVASRLSARDASASSRSVGPTAPEQGQRVVAGRGSSPSSEPGGKGGGASDSDWGSALEEPVAPNTASGALFVGGTLAAGLVVAAALLGGTTSELPDGVKGGVLSFGSSLASSQGVHALAGLVQAL